MDTGVKKQGFLQKIHESMKDNTHFPMVALPKNISKIRGEKIGSLFPRNSRFHLAKREKPNDSLPWIFPKYWQSPQ